MLKVRMNARVFRGPPFNLQGAVVFFCRQIIYCNFAPWRTENFKFYMFIGLYKTVLQINNLFRAESARNYLFHKHSSTPPGDWMVAPLESVHKLI